MKDISGNSHGQMDLKECMFYKRISPKDPGDHAGHAVVECNLCPHMCRIDENKTGICKTRINIKGTLRSLNYEKLTSIALDPIEKKPLFHFYPGKVTLSAGSFGCNFRCLHCQNFEISNSEFSRYKTLEVNPDTLVMLARNKGSEIISYTYNEPTVFYEFVLETAKLARSEGLKNVLVTNGFISKEPLEALLPYIDAANVDLKAFSGEFYKNVCFGTLNPVLETLKIMKEKGTHLEITYLIIPGMNDSEKEIGDACRWIHDNLGNDIPLHFSRFFPMFRMQNRPVTPIDTLIRARQIAIETGIRYCYIGNINRDESNNKDRGNNLADTVCPSCRSIVIERENYDVTVHHRTGSRTELKDDSGKIICKCGFGIYGRN